MFFSRACARVGAQASSCRPEGMQKRMTTVLNHAATGCQGTACESVRLRGRNGPLGLLEQIALMLPKHTSPSSEHSQAIKTQLLLLANNNGNPKENMGIE